MNYLVLVIVLSSLSAFVYAGNDNHDHAVNRVGAVISASDPSKMAAFDILGAHVHQDGNNVTFHMTTNGRRWRTNAYALQ